MKTLLTGDQIGGNHYGNGLQPWDLQLDMQSTGDVFIDGRRTDIIEYVFRIKAAPNESPLQAIKRDAEKVIQNAKAIIARIDQIEPPPDTCMAMEARPPMDYQSRIARWMSDLWGINADPKNPINDLQERCFRFFEESSELVQSLGMSYCEAVELITYVWQRPKGETEQEIGGVCTTLFALGCTYQSDIMECAERELERVNRPEIKAKIRAKHFSKPVDITSPLPGTLPKYDLIACNKCGRLKEINQPCYACIDPLESRYNAMD